LRAYSFATRKQMTRTYDVDPIHAVGGGGFREAGKAQAAVGGRHRRQKAQASFELT